MLYVPRHGTQIFLPQKYIYVYTYIVAVLIIINKFYKKHELIRVTQIKKIKIIKNK